MVTGFRRVLFRSPATIAGWMCECGVKLEDGLMELSCPACGKRYSRRGDKVTRIADESE